MTTFLNRTLVTTVAGLLLLPGCVSSQSGPLVDPAGREEKPKIRILRQERRSFKRKNRLNS